MQWRHHCVTVQMLADRNTACLPASVLKRMHQWLAHCLSACDGWQHGAPDDSGELNSMVYIWAARYDTRLFIK